MKINSGLQDKVAENLILFRFCSLKYSSLFTIFHYLIIDRISLITAEECILRRRRDSRSRVDHPSSRASLHQSGIF